jgi:uncharacterized protein
VAQSAGLMDLTREGCLRLLAAGTVGRIVFTRAAMPAVEPVTYVLDGQEIVFHVPSDGVLAAAIHNAVVGFHVDSIDPTDRTGWSVLGIGTAHQVAGSDRRAALTQHGAGRDPGDAGVIVAVPMEQVSGRRLHLGR